MEDIIGVHLRVPPVDLATACTVESCGVATPENCFTRVLEHTLTLTIRDIVYKVS